MYTEYVTKMTRLLFSKIDDKVLKRTVQSVIIITYVYLKKQTIVILARDQAE